MYRCHRPKLSRMLSLLEIILLLLFNLPFVVKAAAATRYHHYPDHKQNVNNENKTFIRVDNAPLSVLGIHKIALGVFKKEHPDDAIKVMIDWSGLQFTIMGRQKEEEDIQDDDQYETFLDLVIVKVPDKCLLLLDSDETAAAGGEGAGTDVNNDNCDDWSTSVGGIGVPARSNEPTMQYCCTPQARDDGACTEEQDLGHVLFNPDIHQFRRVITFSSRADADDSSISTTFIGTNPVDGTPIYERRRKDIYLHLPGTYLAIFANCHENNQNNFNINGTIIWELQHDEQVTLMSKVSAFHISIAMGYCTLLVWFYYNNLYNTTTTTTTTTPTYTIKTTNTKTMTKTTPMSPRTMQEWILLVIGVGLVEALLRAVQYHVWAYTGNRNVGGMALVAMLMGAVKQSLGRHVMLFIALGGGTTNNSMMGSSSGSSYSWPRIQHWIIIALSTAFFLASALYDFLLWFSTHYPEHKKTAFHALSTIISYQFAFQGIFLIAIPIALCCTMRQLKMKTQQPQKTNNKQLLQQKYRLLLAIIVGGVLWTLTTFALYFFTTYADTEMDVHESNQMDFFVMLTLVAVVCRPNPQQQEQQQQQASGDLAYITTSTKSVKLRTNYCDDEESGSVNMMKLNDSLDDDFNAGGGRYPKSYCTSSSFSKWDNDIDPYWHTNDDEDTLPSLKSSSY